MGLIHGNMMPLLREHARRPLSGRVLFLGYPDVFFDMEQFHRMARAARVRLLEAPLEPNRTEHGRARNWPGPGTLCRCLGLEGFAVMDYSDFEGADVVWDLNRRDLPAELLGAFDLIVDHGTMEHVFHVPNLLANLHDMLKVGGRVMHSTPGNNCFDHGFFQFSPTFFSDYYGANGWEINLHQVVSFTPRQDSEPAFFTDYEPGMFDSLSYGGLDSRIYGTVFIATRTEGATAGIIPQQRSYAATPGWRKDRGHGDE